MDPSEKLIKATGPLDTAPRPRRGHSARQTFRTRGSAPACALCAHEDHAPQREGVFSFTPLSGCRGYTSEGQQGFTAALPSLRLRRPGTWSGPSSAGTGSGPPHRRGHAAPRPASPLCLPCVAALLRQSCLQTQQTPDAPHPQDWFKEEGVPSNMPFRGFEIYQETRNNRVPSAAGVDDTMSLGTEFAPLLRAQHEPKTREGRTAALTRPPCCLRRRKGHLSATFCTSTWCLWCLLLLPHFFLSWDQIRTSGDSAH